MSSRRDRARLPLAHLRLAIADAILAEPRGSEVDLVESIVDRLWREDADVVRTIAQEMTDSIALRDWHLETKTEAVSRSAPLRPIPTRNRRGLTVNEFAARVGLDRATLVALLDHNGFLELRPFGRNQSRRVVSDAAFRAEVGHTVIPANRIGHLEGYAKAAPFPVFYPKRIDDVMECLGWAQLIAHVESLATKRGKLEWLLAVHPYLPAGELARLSGYSRRGIIKSRSPRLAALAPASL